MKDRYLLCLFTSLFILLVTASWSDAAWYSGWNYRKSHVINSATGAGTNYQVKITVHYSGTGDNGENVYCNSHCRPDFGDIRFTGSDGATLLDYWIESKTDSNNAVFWVEVGDSLESNNQTIYIYYGNSGVSTTSSGDNTFPFLDDFSSNDFSKWNIINNSANICNASSGYARLGGTYSGGYSYCQIRTKNSLTGNVQVDFDLLYAKECDEFFTISTYTISNNTDNPVWGICGGISYCAAHSECNNPSYGGCCFGNCGVLVSSTEHYSFAVAGVGGSYNLGFNGNGQWCTSGHTDNEYRIDNIRVRKHTSPEPAHGAWGGEVPQYSSYKTKVGSATDWAWKIVYSSDTVNKVPSGTPTDWTWQTWTPNSGRKVPQGTAADWTWGPE